MDRMPFFELLTTASPVVKGVLLILAVLSLACWSIAIEKLFRIAAFSRFVSRLARTGGGFDGNGNWLAVRLRAVADAEPRDGSETRSEFNARLERSLQSELGAQIQRLQSGLHILATVGATAPFIGLFGTVWGIMHSFSGIAAAKDTSLATVAPGIAEALFATAMGLAAAIPAVLFYNQANMSLSRIAMRLSAIVMRLAKERSYSSLLEDEFANGHAAAEAGQKLTNGGVGAR